MDNAIREDVLNKRPRNIPLWYVSLLFLAVVGAVVAFATQLMGPRAADAWRIFLVNFLFWTGIAQAGVVFSCALRIARARWAGPALRIAEGLGAFLPVSFLLLIVLLVGGKSFLPFATEPELYGHKLAWLNFSFVAARHVVGLLVLFFLSLLYVYYSLRQDLGGVDGDRSLLCSWISSGWGGEEERRRCYNRLLRLAPAIALLYAVLFSFVAWDFMMSLDHEWYSTLFGVYYFEASFLGAVAFTALLAVFLRNRLGLADYVTRVQFRDLGRLIFGFCLGWAYLFFSQFLPIWYGNMPEEAEFVIRRVHEQPYETVSWAVIVACFFFPLVALLPRTNKVVGPIFAFITTVILGGLWLEKFVLVVPAFTDRFHISLAQWVITAGFLALFLLAFTFFVRSFPLVPVGDPLYGGKQRSGGH